ncbi:MAG: CRTAC1 family protein [Luteitalea sp.]|nr:CRTAC1 family protein [Luteitalea sp.]
MTNLRAVFVAQAFRPAGLVLVLAILLLASARATDSSTSVFTDVTKEAGIRFRHTNGAFGKKYLPETMGSGVVVLDANGDGHQDLFFVNSRAWPGHGKEQSRSAFYRNNGDATFMDATRDAGLVFDAYAMGGAAADYDNDGDVDLYVTALGPNRLFRNDGEGRFEDVTKRAGVGDTSFSMGAMWFDFDKDGRLDLYVANYVQWSIEKDLFCTLDGKTKSYCTPESYAGQTPRLYRNKGDGTFDDVTERAGLHDPTSKALGVAVIDYDDDGWPDLFVANDTQPNRLYRNNGDATFTDEGVAAGVAFDETGVARAGMGVDAADYDGSGRQSLIIGNFANEMMALYHNEGNGLFIDEAPPSALGRQTLLTLTFGCFFFDYDLDGWLDILAVNGHVADDINRVQPNVTYAQRPQLFRSQGGKRFVDVSAAVGQAFQQPIVGRGAAYLDYDNDGDLDLVVTANNGPARLLRNDGASEQHALRVATIGSVSNRSGLGAKVVATVAKGQKRWALVKSGSSYLSQSDLAVTFGLGRAPRVSALDVRWPSGRVDRVGAVDAGQTVIVREGKGIVRRVPFIGATDSSNTK